jgi:hypothetical protein
MKKLVRVLSILAGFAFAVGSAAAVGGGAAPQSTDAPCTGAAASCNFVMPSPQQTGPGG